MKKTLLFGLALMLLTFSCKKEEESFPPEPQIYYESTLPNTINVFDTNANTVIRFGFVDGDGDIGTDPKGETMSIYLRDSRDTSMEESTYQYPFPFIPDAIRDKKSIGGSLALNLGNQYYRIWDSLHLALQKDTMVWSIYIMDDAGNKSNIIHSDTIYIQYGQ